MKELTFCIGTDMIRSNFYDKNGKLIDNGSTVEAPDPDETDIHQHSFVGTVVGVRGINLLTVEDGDGNCFDIEANRLEIVED